jgi:hypothetical protein
MKNFIKIISIFLLMFCNTTIKAQTTCGTAVSLSIPINTTVTSYTASEYWFKITIGPGNYQFNVKSSSSTNKINRGDIYTGTCGSPVLYGTDTLFDASADSLLFISITNTVSTTYNIKLGKTGGNTTFTVTGSTICLIAGDIGFCSGASSINLIAGISTPGSAPYTYTWSPGGANTSSITVSSPTPTTYTLTYHDGGGTYTATVTTFTLPTNLCNCQLVQNACFESCTNAYLNVFNVGALPSTCTVAASQIDLANWNAPSCGSPDYFNAIYPSSVASDGVPTNAFTTPTYTLNANSGNGYAGLFAYTNGGYREYLQSPLNCSLIAGLMYNVSFYVSLAGKSPMACNNLGAYISTSTITTSSSLVLPYTPQVNSSSVINNKGSWTKISGNYTASGGEQYVTVGNFYDTPNTTTVTCPSGSLTGNAYYYVDDVSITPATPTVTASNCQSGTVTITAYGAPNSTVTTWAGPSSYSATGSSISVASPTAAVTYTCTVNTGTCTACTLTQTITINPVSPCSGTAPSYTPATSYTFNANSGYATSNIQVISGVNYTINSADLRMAPGISITVKNGGTLIIKGSWIHSCNTCTNNAMWQGIIVENGGTLATVSGGNIHDPWINIIEDAVEAVHTASTTATTPIPNWGVSNTIFNNCATGFYIDAHPGDLSTNTISNNVIFTCRNLKSHAVVTSNLTAIKNDIIASTPHLLSSQNPTDLTAAGLRSKYGIYLKDVSATYSISAVAIGSGAKSSNLFDNLDYGIYGDNSAFTAKNNRFQNLTGNSNSTPYGIGIYGTDPRAPALQIIIGNGSTSIDNTEKNYFINCLRGIMLDQYKLVYINNNTFDNETTATTFTTSSSLVTGEFGVYLSKFAQGANNVPHEVLQFANNSSQNFCTAFSLDFNRIYNTASQSLYITSNSLTATGSNYSNTGLYLQQSTSFGANAGVPIDALNITANTITNISTNCISASAINTSTATTGFVTVNSNTELSLKYSTLGTSTLSPPIAAVYLSGCNRVKVSNNPLITTTGFGTSPYPTSYAQYLQGIYITQSPNSRITCNVVSEFGEDLVWLGNSAGSLWEENTMGYGQYGLVLRTSGIMGDQFNGSAGQPINDIWARQISGGLSIAQTLCDGSNPGTGTTSKLTCQAQTCTATTTYMPCTNTISAVPGSVAYASPATLISTTVTTSPGLCTSEGGNGFMANHNNNAQDAIADSSLTAMLNFNDSLPVYTWQTYWATQYYVSSINNSLSAASGYENAKTFASVDGAIANADYVTAQNLLTGITINNGVESNWKTVSNILITLGLNNSDSLTPNDITILKTVAQQCPLSGGSIVWRARAMINKYYMNIINYPSDCPDLSGNIAHKTSNVSIFNAVINPTINLFPNPNNGSMTLEYKIGKDAHLEIVDLNGNLVETYNLPATENHLEIKNEQLINGVYLYRIISNNTVVKFGKVVVMK